MQESEKTIEVNSTSHPDYTFQRHSAPKNIAYYRCSDKRCKARLYYDLVTKEISFKNDHLDPKIHKRPKSSCVISVNDAAGADGSNRRCISTHSFASLPSNSNSETTLRRDQLPSRSSPVPPTFIKKSVRAQELVRVYLTNVSQAHELCREAVKMHHATQASCLENAMVYTLLDECLTIGTHAAVADIELETTHRESFLRYVQETFAGASKIRVFKS